MPPARSAISEGAVHFFASESPRLKPEPVRLKVHHGAFRPYGHNLSAFHAVANAIAGAVDEHEAPLLFGCVNMDVQLELGNAAPDRQRQLPRMNIFRHPAG